MEEDLKAEKAYEKRWTFLDPFRLIVSGEMSPVSIAYFYVQVRLITWR